MAPFAGAVPPQWVWHPLGMLMLLEALFTIPQQCSPHAGVPLGCWGLSGSPGAPGRAGIPGLKGAGGRKTPAQVGSRVQTAPVPAEYLCLTEKSAHYLWIWEAGSLRRQEMENRYSRWHRQARRQAGSELMGFCELHFVVNYKQLLAAFPSPHF